MDSMYRDIPGPLTLDTSFRQRIIPRTACLRTRIAHTTELLLPCPLNGITFVNIIKCGYYSDATTKLCICSWYYGFYYVYVSDSRRFEVRTAELSSSEGYVIMQSVVYDRDKYVNIPGIIDLCINTVCYIMALKAF